MGVVAVASLPVTIIISTALSISRKKAKNL